MQQGDRTASVHGASTPKRGSLVMPVHQSSTFILEDAEDVDAVYEGRREGDIYSRLSNPTVSHVEAHLARLERTEDALVSGSGMAAISTTVLSLVGKGGRIVAVEDLYGTTRSFFDELSARFGVRVDLVPTADVSALGRALESPADLVYLETPTNPTLRLADLQASAALAREAGVVSAVDSTFATPIATRPHELGVDLVLHSATKYLCGHSDILAGAVCGPDALVARVRGMQKLLGPVLDPHAAFLLQRGLRTLPLRVRAASENALAMAHALEADARVLRVHHPGLASHPQHELAKRQMRHFGGVLSFDLASLDHAKRFLEALRLVRNAASLGGVESLASLPVQQSHRGQGVEMLKNSGIVPGTVRLALGIEDAADLEADVLRALDESHASTAASQQVHRE